MLVEQIDARLVTVDAAGHLAMGASDAVQDDDTGEGNEHGQSGAGTEATGGLHGFLLRKGCGMVLAGLLSSVGQRRFPVNRLLQRQALELLHGER